MEGGINLLPQLTEKEIKSGVYRRKTNIAALLTLGSVGLIILAILGYQIFLTVRAEDIKNRTEKAEQDVISHRDVEISNQALKEKLDKIENILTTQVPVSKLIDELSKAAGTSTAPVRVTNIGVVNNGDLDIEGIASSSQGLEDWISNLTNENGQDYFTKINLVSLTGNPTEGYKFSFTMNFLKKGVYQTR